MSPRAHILRYVLSAVVLTACVWVIAWTSVVSEHARHSEESAASARRLAVYFERQTLSIFRYGDAYLKMARRNYLSGLPAEPVIAVTAAMHDVPLDTDIVSHITIVDATGTPVLNSGFPLRPGVNVTDRDYFIHHRDRANPGEDTLFVSLPHQGRNSDRLIIRLVRRISLPDGRFGGVIFAALDAASVTEFFKAMKLGDQSSATLVGLDKRIRARSAYGRLGPGQDISGSRLWQELEKGPTGLYLQTSVVDDITRHYAFRRLNEFPLVVAIGVAVEDASGHISSHQLPAYLLAALATVLFVAVTVLMSRQILANERIRASESQIRGMRDELEVRVAKRTAELQAVQDELIRAERLAVLGQLTGTVAHELRNPLSTIDTSVSVLEKRIAPSDESLTTPFQRIHRNVARCNNIITDLLDFARVHRAEPRSTSLDSWLAETLAELSPAGTIAPDFTPGAGGAVVPVDRDRLRRAIINLIDNARDAVAAGDREGAGIRVSTRIDGNAAVIEVEDDGPGIPADLEQRVREPLFSTKSFGIGLGLSIVEQIMTAHGGSFELESTEGRGTCARLTLPLEEA